MEKYIEKDNNLAITVNQLIIYDHQQPLIQSLSLQVPADSFYCIIGESGSGKSLLARTILNMKSEQLSYDGDIAIDLNQTDAVFQDMSSNFFPNITIEKHFKMIFEIKTSTVSWSSQKQVIIQMMKDLGLNEPESLLRQYPFELSGGMAQRIALIMSLIREPQCLILDEPTSALDQDNQQRLMSMLIREVQKREMTILFITHDLNVVKDYATHVSIMKQGEIIETGDKNQILNHPQHDYTNELVSIAQRRAQYV